MKKNDIILLAGLAALGLFLWVKSSSSAPPVVVTNWNNGAGNWALGGSSGAFSTTATGQTVVAGPYQMQIDGFDGTGYNILILQGTQILNSVYVTGNGSFS